MMHDAMHDVHSFFYKNKIDKNVYVKIVIKIKNIWKFHKLIVLKFDFCSKKVM